MARAILLLLGIAALVGGLWCLRSGVVPSAIVFAAWGVLLVVGTVYERVHYKRIEAARPGPGWRATDEKFIDEATGQPVTVYIETATGERKYVSG